MERRSDLAARLSAGSEGLDARGILWLLSMTLVLVVLLLPFSSYVAALSFIQDEWGLNNTQAGAVFSAYLAGYAVSALFIVPLTDRFGLKPIFLCSAIVSVIAHALFPLVAHGMASGVILRAVAGLGLAGVYMPGLRVVAERFHERARGVAMGMIVTAYYTAINVSLVATGGLMSILEWREAYLFLALAGASSLPVAYLLLRSHRHAPDTGSSGRLNLAVLKNRPVRYFILGYSLHAVELYAVRVWLPAFLMAILVARGVQSAQAAATSATVGGLALAVGSVGPVMGGAISDRWGRATSASAIFALSGACSLAIGWMGGLPWALVLVVAVVFGWAIAADSSIYSTAITEDSKAAQLGSTMAVQAFLGFMGGVVGPIAVGGILDASPESIRWGIGFSCIGLLSVVAIGAMMRVRSLPRVEDIVARGGERSSEPC